MIGNKIAAFFGLAWAMLSCRSFLAVEGHVQRELTCTTETEVRFVTSYDLTSFDNPIFDNVEEFIQDAATKMGELYEFVKALPIPGFNASVSYMSRRFARHIAKLPFVVAVEEDTVYSFHKPVRTAAYTPSEYGYEEIPYGIELVGALGK